MPNMEDNLLHKQGNKSRQQMFSPNLVFQP